MPAFSLFRIFHPAPARPILYSYDDFGNRLTKSGSDGTVTLPDGV
ncbi:Uncharacterized protein dnm_090430 [Desulfonema magnum]|uniref:RHS repeat-associated core domain-containing protein n=1 Tax=Desulfonema magnum TaxID=45655 RepID=A0A975BXE0_9BACT|nr:Uncharacterized protein dnm_090430 [Desulfonema magnum]